MTDEQTRPLNLNKFIKYRHSILNMFILYWSTVCVVNETAQTYKEIFGSLEVDKITPIKQTDR